MYELYNSMGIAYDLSKNWEMALKCYDLAIQKNENYHSSYYNKGIIYKKLKKDKKAV